jgi:hypothetical protein
VRKALSALVIAGLFTGNADAHELIRPGRPSSIAEDSFTATPGVEWNRLQQSGGEYQEVWTIDGDGLNKITFFGGVPVGEPLFEEFDEKHHPLPKVTPNMLITDIPPLLEATYRTGTNTGMRIGKQDAALLDGNRAIRFSYSFMRSEDGVERKGEGFGAFVSGKLYLVTYEAPALYFFDRTIEEFRKIAASLRITK